MMIVYLPLGFAAAFGLLAPVLSRHIPPRVATWLLSVGGLIAAAGSSASVGLLAFRYVAQAPFFAAEGRWSNSVLQRVDVVGAPIGLSACAALMLLTARFADCAWRRVQATRDAYRLARALPRSECELSVVGAADAQAYAVPGRPGRIVVTTGLLRVLDGDQRRAVITHEKAHLQHRHHLHQTGAHLAAALNPLLGGLPDAVAHLCERWADEDAAAAGRSRDIVAEALTLAAMSRPLVGGAVLLAAAGGDVADRVNALRAPAPQLGLWRPGLLLALAAATGVAAAVAVHDTERLFELAQSAYRGDR
jgi:hypothetical protein